MAFSIGRWKPGQLLLGWGAYWAGLVAIKLGPAIRESWRVTRLPEGHGTINAAYDKGLINYSVVEDGVNRFASSVSVSTALMWILVPPIVLWAIWLFARVRPSVTQSVGAAENAALSAGAAPDFRVTDRDRVPADRIHTPKP